MLIATQGIVSGILEEVFPDRSRQLYLKYYQGNLCIGHSFDFNNDDIYLVVREVEIKCDKAMGKEE